MELILAIVLGFFIAGVGFVVGVATTNKLEKQLERKSESLQTQLDTSPTIIECQLGEPLTLDQMSIEVVTSNLTKIWRHFGKGLDTMPPITPIAEEMLRWYNPDSEFTKLVIAGYLRGGDIKVAWTWQRKSPQYIISKDALEGLEKYYEDDVGNPVIFNPMA